MKKFLIFQILFFTVVAYSQDISNAYIKNIKFRWKSVEHNATHCGGDPGSESAEWKIRPYVEDDFFNNYGDFHSSSSENSNSLYECDPFEKSDVDGLFNEYNIDDVFYNVTNNSYNFTEAEYRIFFIAWESDGCGPTFEYNTNCGNGDDCPIGTAFDLNMNFNASDRIGPSASFYNGEWHSVNRIFYRGPSNNLFNRLNVECMFSIPWNIGIQSNPFEFGTIDQGGCFYEKKHYFNTNDDGRSMTSEINYRFTLLSKRSIKIDWSENTFSSNPTVFLAQTFGITESAGGGANEYKEYYNLDPGTYTITINLGYPSSQTSHSKYKLSISQIAVASPASVIHYWNGSENQNWFEPCNWSTNHVPNEDNDVIIDNTSNLPIIYSAGNATPDNANGYSAGHAHCNSIDVQSGAKVTIESPPFGTAKLNVNH